MCSKHRNVTRGPGTIRPDLDHPSWQKPLEILVHFWPCFVNVFLMMWDVWDAVNHPCARPWAVVWDVVAHLLMFTWIRDPEHHYHMHTHNNKCPCCWLSLAGQHYWSVNVCWWYPGYFLHSLAWTSVCYMCSDCTELMYCFVLDIKYEWLVFLNRSYPLCFYFKYTI